MKLIAVVSNITLGAGWLQLYLQKLKTTIAFNKSLKCESFTACTRSLHMQWLYVFYLNLKHIP